MANSVATVGKEQETSKEARLWQAVIVSTVEEWVSGPLRRSREAEKFLFSDNADFRLVCESAGMDVEALRQRLTKFRDRSVARPDVRIAA
jgi:hypothetical protein